MLTVLCSESCVDSSLRITTVGCNFTVVKTIQYRPRTLVLEYQDAPSVCIMPSVQHAVRGSLTTYFSVGEVTPLRKSLHTQL